MQKRLMSKVDLTSVKRYTSVSFSDPQTPVNMSMVDSELFSSYFPSAKILLNSYVTAAF